MIWLTPDPIQHVFVAFVAGGMCAAIAATNSYHLPTVYTFTVAASVPWVIGLIIKGEPVYIALAAMWVIFGLFLCIYARMANTILLKSLRLQKENAELVKNLSQARDTLEERVHERTAELEAINTALQDEMLAHAETERHLRQAQKMEAVGQLTGGIAHDFNNLLAIIQGNAELLDDAGNGNAPMAAAILRATDRGASLTQRLLAFSRRQPLRPQTIDLTKLTDNISELLARTLGETVTVTIRSAPDLWPVRADYSQVENALLNLAINARDAMPDGGALRVEISNMTVPVQGLAGRPHIPAGDFAVLSVTDTGTGMTEDVLEHAFEPFFTTKEVGKGSGLGLSMIYGFAEQSGGHVDITSSPGVGTAVSLFLPRSRDVVQSGMPKKAAAIPRGNGELILVIEDDQDVRKLTVTMLHGLDYRTLEAEDIAGAEAICDRETKIDLVLSDVVLPGGQSGLDFAATAADRYKSLKFLFMSGYPAPVSKTLPATEITVLKKPFRKRELGEAVSRALQRPA